MTTVFSQRMHWAKEPVFHMLSVSAGNPLFSGHVRGMTPFVARSWTIDQMVVWKVVGAGSLVVTLAVVSLVVTICAFVGGVSIGIRFGAGGSVLFANVPVALAGAIGSSAGRVGSSGGVDVMVEMGFVVCVHFVGCKFVFMGKCEPSV